MVGRYKRKNANSKTKYAHSTETTISAEFIKNDFRRATPRSVLLLGVVGVMIADILSL